MTQTAIAVWEPDQQEMDIYRRHYAPQGTTDEDWEIFLETCRAYRVSPIRKQIYLVSRYDSVKKRNASVPQVSIGTLRLMALRTHEFEGTTEPEWADESGAWHTCWPKAKGKHPYAARVGVYRKGFRTPVWGIVYFHEVAQTTDVWENNRKTGEKRLTKFWEDSGIHQLAKCAEADGLRKAFEEECGGVYIHEEMLQADSDRPPVSIIPVVESDDPETNEALKETANKSQANGHKPAETIAITRGDLYATGEAKGLWSRTSPEKFYAWASSISARPQSKTAWDMTITEMGEMAKRIYAEPSLPSGK